MPSVIVISDLQTVERGRLRVRVLSSEHAYIEIFRPINLIEGMLSTKNSNSESSSRFNLKVAIICVGAAIRQARKCGN